MADVVFRQRAWRDLDRIETRIASDDPAAAQRFRTVALRRIGLLERLPESAQPRPKFGPDIRTIPIGRYIVILRVALPKVIVLRIVHGARDLPRLFKPGPKSFTSDTPAPGVCSAGRVRTSGVSSTVLLSVLTALL